MKSSETIAQNFDCFSSYVQLVSVLPFKVLYNTDILFIKCFFFNVKEKVHVWCDIRFLVA